MFQQLPGMNIPGLRQLISTRQGGVSVGGFSTLNIAYHVGDDTAAVTANRRILAQAANYPAEELIAAQQIHGAGLLWVSAADKGSGALDAKSAIADCDGLLVSDRDIPVAIMVADCAPVLIVDPHKKMLAVVHVGWRGAVAGIVSAAIKELCNAGSDPSDIQLAIGPTLCPRCFDTNDNIAAQFSARFGNKVVQQIADRAHLDIRKSIIADAASAGISKAQINIHPACTRCQADIFFSHRQQNGNAGRFALIAWWERTEG